MKYLMPSRKQINSWKKRIPCADFLTSDLEKMLFRYAKKKGYTGLPKNWYWRTITEKQKNGRKSFLYQKCIKYGLI